MIEELACAVEVGEQIGASAELFEGANAAGGETTSRAKVEGSPEWKI